MEKGFQLLELTLALTLALAVGTWGILTTSRLVEVYRLYSAGCSIVSTATTARSLAIAKGTAVELSTDLQNGRVGLRRPGTKLTRWSPLPPGVRFVKVPTREVIFHSRGTAAPAGTLELENSSGSMRVIVAVSGRVRWEQK